MYQFEPTAARKTRRKSAFRWVVLGLLAMTGQAQADDYCVSELFHPTDFTSASPGLINALLHIKSSPSGFVFHRVRLQRGTPFELTSTIAIQLPQANIGKHIELLGGYAPGCSEDDRVIDPSNTVIDGSGSHGFLISAESAPGMTFKIEGIRFEGVKSVEMSSDCSGCAPHTTFDVSRNVFDDTDLTLSTRSFHSARVSTNLFRDGTLLLHAGTTNGAGESADISFNTFSTSVCDDDFPYAARLFSSNSAEADFHHNIVRTFSPCEGGVTLGPDGTPWVLRNNLLHTFPPQADLFIDGGGNVMGAVSVGFVEPGEGNFRLKTDSPQSVAINVGMTEGEMVAAGLADQFPGPDLDGKTRPIGGRFDIGAYESSYVGPNALTVTNTNDMGSGSLRAAVDAANGQLGPQTIQFNIPGACTSQSFHLITLASPLQILDSVVIDGYSQPGALANTALLAFNGRPCIHVTANVLAPLDSALVVPAMANAGLTVKGLSFSSLVSAEAAIGFFAGSGHVVTGNVFEGSSLAGGSLDGVRLALAGSATVGGPAASDRNVFKGIVDTAVEVSGGSGAIVVRNNLMGLAENGETARAQARGVRVGSGSNVQIRDNVIAASSDAAIVLQGSASGVKVYSNRLGQSATGATPAELRNNDGVRVYQSAGHQIGSGTNATLANSITNSNRFGISIIGDESVSVRVARNQLFGNGVVFGGLGLDLGSSGREANDAGDVDPGPNHLQNWPTLTLATLGPDGARGVEGTLGSAANQPYQIDIYRSPSCIGGNRADARFWVGRVEGVTPSSNAPKLFTAQLSSASAPGFLTAIATAPNGDSSEISPCLQEPVAQTQLPPELPAQSFAVEDDAVAGSLIGTPTVSDDEGTDQLLFSIIAGNATGAFSILPESGGIVLVDPALLPPLPLWLTVKVTDSDGLSDTAIMTLMKTAIFCDSFELPATGCSAGDID